MSILYYTRPFLRSEIAIMIFFNCWVMIFVALSSSRFEIHPLILNCIPNILKHIIFWVMSCKRNFSRCKDFYIVEDIRIKMDSFVSSQVRMYLTKHGVKYISYYFHGVTTIVHAMLKQKEKILNRIIEIIFEHPFDVVFSLRLTFKGSYACKMCHCEWYH